MNTMRAVFNRITAYLAILSMLLSAGVARSNGAELEPSGVPLTLVLRLHHQAELDELIRQQSNPDSPSYHRFLTVEQFRNYFAPSPLEYARTLQSLRLRGFDIAGLSPNRTLIKVLAKPYVVKQTFGTIVALTSEGHSTHYYAVRPLTVPRALPNVEAVIGLERKQLLQEPTERRTTPRSRHLASGTKTLGPDGGFGPAAINTGFDFPVIHGFTGDSVRVADVTAGATSDSDVSVFLRYFGIKRSVPKTKVIIVPDKGASGFLDDTQQADLDAEWILSTAPGVSLTNYYMYPANSFTLVDAFSELTSANDVDVVNLSLMGACENQDPSLAIALGGIFEQGAAQGIAFESGQFAAGGCEYPIGTRNYPHAFPMGPAENPYGLTIGGSNVVESPTSEVVGETGWYGTGGGISMIFSTFAAQAQVEGVNMHGRNTPDFALPASVNGSGPSYYYSLLSWAGGGALGNNAPAAGLLASYVQMTKSRLGAFDMTLYDIFRSRGYGPIFSDIATGCEAESVNGVRVCAAKGYDIVSGIGSFDGYEVGRLLK